MFREAVLALLGAPAMNGPQTPQDEYCRSCKEAGMDDDCASCSREIEVLK